MHLRPFRSRFALSVLGAALCVGVAAPVSAYSGVADVTAAPYGSPGQGPVTQVGHAVGSDSASLMSAQVSAPAITRTEVMSRAASWFDIGLKYDGYSSYQGYRKDCSGYASMAWKLGSSVTTNVFGPSGVTKDITKAELKAGDALKSPLPATTNTSPCSRSGPIPPSPLTGATSSPEAASSTRYATSPSSTRSTRA